MRWYGTKRCLGLIAACAGLLGAAPAAYAAKVLYNGGPVSHAMTGVLVDWGSSVSPIYTDPSAGDPGLIKSFAAGSGSTGNLGGVLAQYMDSSSHNAANQDTYGGQYQITPSVSSTTISDTQIANELVSQIGAGSLPRPAGNGLTTIYLVVFPPGDTECIDSQDCSGNTFCAYHSNAYLPDGTNVLYAVLPDNTTGPMTQGCGTARTLFQDQTSYLSHEWTEAISDPLGTAWWDSSRGGTGNEIADWCNQYMVQNGSWTVQEVWSNLDNNCMGSESAYSAPTASFLAPSTASPGELVSVDGSASADPASNHTAAAFNGSSYSISRGIASYSWNWGDGSAPSTTSTSSASHVFLSPGTYQVSLTVTDNLGFTSTVTHAVSVAVGSNPTPTVTTGAATGIDDQGATLGGALDPAGLSVTYQFDYGTAQNAMTQSTASTAGPTGVTSQPVSATLSGLAPSTTYYYQLVVTVGGAQTYVGSVESFTTNAVPPPPQAPTVATGAATQLATGAATLNGSVNPGGTAPVAYWFAYGTSPSALTATSPQATQPAGTTAAPVSAALTGLSPGTTYYYELEASLNGSTYSGQVETFQTAVPAPGASTGSASNITSSTATVAGSVDPAGAATTYFVEFGPTGTYGQSTPAVSAGSGTAAVPVSVQLAGLSPRTTYHYRVVASSAGGTIVGLDATFTTPQAPPQPPHFGFSVPSHLRLSTLASAHLRVHFTCASECIVHFLVTVVAKRLTRTGSVPLTVAHGTGRLPGASAGTSLLHFIPHLTARLLRRHRLRLAISAFAVGAGSPPSPPQVRIVSVGSA